MLLSKKITKESVQEPKLIYRPNLDNLEIASEIYEFSPKKNVEVPWDCLNETRRKVVYGYIYEKKDFQTLATDLNLNNAARVKAEFYYALTSLSEYGTMRLFLVEQGQELTESQRFVMNHYYCSNMSLKDIAHAQGTSKQSIQQVIKRVITKYGLKWQVFVRRKEGQLIFMVPEILK
jgi:predicted DNA-binding protein YlxM (UPF0122 family)